MTTTGFIYIELANLPMGQPFDGMAFGTFTDMLGREVKLQTSDGEAIVNNTLAHIEATRTDSGELVGLPIDAGNHDKGDAAGWIVGAELVGDIIRLVPKWTEIGRELISKGIRRFFSPTVNLSDLVILGGALVNWPATTDKTGKVLLRPIELSSNIYSIHEVSDMDEQEVVEQVVEEVDAPETPEADTTEGGAFDVVELTRQIRADLKAELQAELQAELARDRAARHIAEFAKGVTAGPVGLPVGVEEVEELLTRLGADERQAVESILTRTVDKGLVDFGETGHGKTVAQKYELPQLYVDKLNAGELQVADLSHPIIADDLGDLDQYDLTKWESE